MDEQYADECRSARPVALMESKLRLQKDSLEFEFKCTARHEDLEVFPGDTACPLCINGFTQALEPLGGKHGVMKSLLNFQQGAARSGPGDFVFTNP